MMLATRSGRARPPVGFDLRRVISLLIALALVAAACGGGDDADGTDTESDGSKETTEESESTDTESEADADEDESAEGDGAADDAVVVRWFVGVGTGSQDAQIPGQQELVDDFNASRDDVQIEVEFVPNETAAQQLATQISAGNPPDIIGPIGREGSNSFAGQFLALDELIESTGFDLSLYDEAQVETWREDDGALRGLPFASFPSAIYYNKELFDAAELPYPPTEYGPDGTSTYGEGTEWEGIWDWDKLTEIAQLMTIDEAGLNATEAGFDSEATEQWGYVHQWTEPPQAQGSFWGAGRIEQEDGSAKIPQAWIDEWKWYHSAKHEIGFVPDQTELDSDLLAGNAFNSGRVAMANTHLWYTCCLSDADDNAQTFWDLAVVPSYEGNVVSKLHADIFRIHKDTANPDEAFEVLSYFQNDIALDLLTIYGAMPARNDIRADYFTGLDEKFTQGVNWDAIVAGLAYPDSPSHEVPMPEHLESLTLIEELEGEISGDPELDIDARVTEIEEGLNALWVG